MSDTHPSTAAHEGPGYYEIRLQGHLDQRWAGRFEGLQIRLQANGDTLLTGPLVDQAALHGVLRRIRDLGLPLLSVIRAETGRPGGPTVKKGGTHKRNDP